MVTTLPDLSREYPLRQDQIAGFQANGHILLPGVLNAAEIAAYRPLINDAAYRYNTERRKMEDRDTYGKAFLQIMNLWRRDEQVAQFTLAKRLAGIAARLLGAQSVRLYHDQALYKEAGGGITPWHQDQYYWPVDTPRTITMWMPLIDIAEAQWGYVEQFLDLLRSGTVDAVSPRHEAMADYEVRRIEAAKKTVFGSGCTSWYLGAEGVPATWPWSYDSFFEEMKNPRMKDFDLRKAG